jgi:hypothetical protein
MAEVRIHESTGPLAYHRHNSACDVSKYHIKSAGIFRSDWPDFHDRRARLRTAPCSVATGSLQGPANVQGMIRWRPCILMPFDCGQRTRFKISAPSNGVAVLRLIPSNQP